MKKSKRKLENTSGQMKIKTKLYKTYGTQQKQFSDVSFSNKGLPQENRKVSNKQPYLPFKGILKRTKYS